MDIYTEDQKLAIYKSAEGLLRISYSFREMDILPEIGKEAALLADKALKSLEVPEKTVEFQAEPSFNKECFCGAEDCQTDNCNGHNAMQPENKIEENVTNFPMSSNSSPEIDAEINNLINKIKGQMNG